MSSSRLVTFFKLAVERTVVLPAVVLSFGLAGEVSGQIADCIAAVVGTEVITLTDIRIHRAFRLLPEPAGDVSPSPVRQALEMLINQKVVIGLTREDIVVDPGEIDRLLAEVKATFDPEEWQSKLDAFGVAEEDLRFCLEQRLRYEKVLRLRFSQNVGVSLKEIESYYHEVFVPQEKAAGREPRPLADVLNDLEPRVERKKADEQLARWIISLRSQVEIDVRSNCLEQIK